MALGDIYQVKIIGTMGNSPWMNVYHYQTTFSLGPEATEISSLVDAIEEVFWFKQLTNDMLDFMHPQVRITEIQIRNVMDNTVGLDYLLDPIQVGVMAGDRVSQQVAMLISKKTDKIGRSYQGRNFLPLGTESYVSGGVWDEAFVEDVMDWFGTTLAIIPAVPVYGFEQVIWSELLQTATPVTSYSVTVRSRSQRRRSY